jgi:hypothetical protein
MSQNVFNRALIWRSIGEALTLNSELYQDAQREVSTRRTAFIIVILAALSRALGGAIISLLNRVTPSVFIITLCLGFLSVVVGYYFWAFTILKLGQLFNLHPPTYTELLYPIGFAYSPQILNIITLIPLLGRPIELILAAWTLLAVTVAVRKAMNTKTRWAVLISFVSFPVIQLVPIMIQVVAQQFAN